MSDAQYLKALCRLAELCGHELTPECLAEADKVIERHGYRRIINRLESVAQEMACSSSHHQSRGIDSSVSAKEEKETVKSFGLIASNSNTNPFWALNDVTNDPVSGLSLIRASKAKIDPAQKQAESITRLKNLIHQEMLNASEVEQ